MVGVVIEKELWKTDTTDFHVCRIAGVVSCCNMMSRVCRVTHLCDFVLCWFVVVVVVGGGGGVFSFGVWFRFFDVGLFVCCCCCCCCCLQVLLLLLYFFVGVLLFVLCLFMCCFIFVAVFVLLVFLQRRNSTPVSPA